MDWFERLTGFLETSYEGTRCQLEIQGTQLHSRINGKSYAIGTLELVSLGELRQRVQAAGSLPGRLKVRVVRGDVRLLHQAPEYADALFQVASQFNLLEMVSPNVTPEQGVTRYEGDPTQGPACAIAAGAATIYRNYFAPVAGGIGQTHDRQLDGLADLGAALEEAIGKAQGQPVEPLWDMRNGYAMGTRSGLDAITAHLASITGGEIDALRGRLRIGVHSDVEVTDASGPADLSDHPRTRVSQAFCSALPVSYSRVPKAAWRLFACLVLEAAYEATLWAGVLNAQRGNSNVVLLTRLGGGAFGNDDDWIDAAMRRALDKVVGFALDVQLVSRSAPSRELLQMVRDFE